MTRKIGLVAAALFFMIAASVSAQKAVITFENKTFDFGQINEDGGNASTVFEFTNTGNATLVIQRVNASCGCTTPEWTQTPVEPGKKGKITAIYNPIGRPGAFNKEIYVYSNASNEMERLSITGNVTPKTTSGSASSGNTFPVSIGALGLTSKTLQLGNINKGILQTRNLTIRNNSGSPLTVTLADVPSHIEAKVTPATLQPNQEGIIGISLNSKKVTEWGPIQEDIYIVLNGKKDISDNFKIIILGNLVEDFSKLSAAEKRQAPIMEIKSSNLHFGNIKKGNKVRGKFAIKNVGSNPLEIRRVTNNNSDITVSPMRMTIRGGKTENLHLDIDTKYLPKGEYKKTFSVQTNDPNRVVVVYVVDFNVI